MAAVKKVVKKRRERKNVEKASLTSVLLSTILS